MPGCRTQQNAQACPHSPRDPRPRGSATRARPRRPSPSPGEARFAGGVGKAVSIARNPIERIVPDYFTDGDPRPGHEERPGAELGDLDRYPPRISIHGLRFALGPFLQPDPQGRFVAQLDTGLRHGGERFAGSPESRDHHRRRPPRHGVVLPRPGVAVAARPEIDAVAVALVVRESALVAVPCERRALAPGVGARAVLGVVRELALVAIAPRPGFHAAAVLLAPAELPGINGASLRRARPFRFPVLAATGVGSLQLRIKHETFGLSERGERRRTEHERQRTEHKRKDKRTADEVQLAVSNHPGGLRPPPLLKKGGEILQLAVSNHPGGLRPPPLLKKGGEEILTFLPLLA